MSDIRTWPLGHTLGFAKSATLSRQTKSIGRAAGLASPKGSGMQAFAKKFQLYFGLSPFMYGLMSVW